MVRSASILVVLALLLPALAGEAPVHDPAVARLLGDGAGAPMLVTIGFSADLSAGGVWQVSNSRDVCGSATAPFRAEMKLGAEPEAIEVRAEVRIENGLVVYDITCLAPVPPLAEGEPPDLLRSMARGACSSFGQLAVLPVTRASGPAQVGVGVWLSVCDGRDRDLFPPDRPAPGARSDRTVALALHSLPVGRGLPGDSRTTASAADASLRDAGARALRRLSLRLAPGASGSLESLVERSYLADFDVEVAQSPTSFIADPIPGSVPVGLSARFAPDAGDLTLDWSYTALLEFEDFETTLGMGAGPVRIQIPKLGTTGGRLPLRTEAALIPLAALADGGTLILDARGGPVE